MSPAYAAGISWRLLACIWSRRPTRSLRSRRTFSTCWPGFDAARVDAQIGQVADVLVGHHLEDERGERLVVARPCAWPASSVLQVDALDRRHVERRRQVGDDRVEQRLHALVLERGAAHDRHDVAAAASPRAAPCAARRPGSSRLRGRAPSATSSKSAAASTTFSRAASVAAASSAGTSATCEARAETLVVPVDAPCARPGR